MVNYPNLKKYLFHFTNLIKKPRKWYANERKQLDTHKAIGKIAWF
jgi:hypothetical protein